MGGKKKTKWRKLPLEEFTKEIPTKPEKVPTNDAYQTECTKEDNNCIPSYNETVESAQNYTEQYEYIDGLWYPTSCVMYNPAEVGLYSNYMIPVDNCYYYYTMPEVPQVQEYVQVPYQEYTPILPKDTVYLLLPTQIFRPTQPSQNLAPEWQSRRRRRYEGYAEYAVIPEKPNSNKAEGKDKGNATGQFINLRSSNHFNNSRKMTSETSKYNDSLSEQNPSCSKSNDDKKKSKICTDVNVRGPMSTIKEDEHLNKDHSESNQKSKKNADICGVHSRNTQKGSQVVSDIKSSFKEESTNKNTQVKKHNNSSELTSIFSFSSNNPDNDLSMPNSINNTKNQTTKLIGQCEERDHSSLLTIESPENNKLFDTQINTKTKNNLQTLQENTVTDNVIQSSIESVSEPNSKHSLPDILSTLSKLPSNEKEKPKNSTEIPPDAAEHEKETHLKSKIFLSQTSYMPNLLSSEALHNEMEMELQQLQNLHSLKANQSIYKLAYAESITDQSEADSRSPSPVDPESNVPSSITSAEILIHEADSGSEAGSEDVELLPHRYESETFLNESKHVYVNKLSLAVELLRTQESLPYDDEFKRVVGENQLNNKMPGVHAGGKINLDFTEDSYKNGIKQHSDSKSTIKSMDEALQYQMKHSAHSSNDSAIFSDVEFDSLEELCETAKEAVAQNTETQNNTEEIRAGYRRLGVQARHYFSPRTALSLNPCFCCIVM